MRANPAIGFVSFIFLITVLSMTVFAQTTSSCSLSVEVVKFKTYDRINGATAAAVNGITKKAYRSITKKGMPFFAKLPAGNYRITVTKSGFSRSIDELALDCAEQDKLWSILLYPGNPGQTAKLYEIRGLMEPYQIKSKDDVKARPVTPGEVNVKPGEEPVISTPPMPKPPVPKSINVGVMNGRAINLVKPPFPEEARSAGASGTVEVEVTVDENGDVTSAKAISGDKTFYKVTEEAAKASKFSPTRLSGQTVKVKGIIIYNFIPKN